MIAGGRIGLYAPINSSWPYSSVISYNYEDSMGGAAWKSRKKSLASKKCARILNLPTFPGYPCLPRLSGVIAMLVLQMARWQGVNHGERISAKCLLGEARLCPYGVIVHWPFAFRVI